MTTPDKTGGSCGEGKGGGGGDSCPTSGSPHDMGKGGGSTKPGRDPNAGPDDKTRQGGADKGRPGGDQSKQKPGSASGTGSAATNPGTRQGSAGGRQNAAEKEDLEEEEGPQSPGRSKSSGTR